MAALGEVPFGLYYGSVDATLLFVVLAGLYVERTGDDATLRLLWPSIKRALAWMDKEADADGDGFLEYGGKKPHNLASGLQHQGWKDSFDAVFHADGRLAQGPIALAEVQGYAYAAKRCAARCAGRLGETELAAELERSATALAERFEAQFWSDELGLYVARPRRREIPHAGEELQCRPSPVDGNRARGSGKKGRRCHDLAGLLLGMGRQDRGQGRGTLQSDVLS